MAGERRFTRIPPESSGDRINMGVCLEIGYNNASNTFSVGDTVALTTSGIGGDISYVRADTGTTGVIIIQPDQTTRETGLTVTDGEAIQVNAVTIAQAVAATSFDLYTNKTQIVSGDNDLYSQTVDKFGAAHVRFSEGPAQLDAFGKLRTSSSFIVGDYIFNQDLLPGYMTQTVATGGTITHDSTAGAALLSTTTTSGSSADFTSNLYHPYFPGVATTIFMTVYTGDAGKTNLTREWGYFDDNNGVFFRLSGTTLSVVKRSNVTGSPVDTVVNQSAWNGDVVDGAGGFDNPSQVNLDVTKLNLYWIDFSWLGGGTVRWGMYANGERIILHTETYGNQQAGAFMKSAALPVNWRQENTGATGSSSEMRIVCCGVHTEQSLHDFGNYGNNVFIALTSRQVNTTADIYLHSFRTTANTHDTFLPVSTTFMAIEGANDAAVKVDYYLGANVANTSWTQYGVSNFEYDTAGTYNGPGTLIGSMIFKGKEKVDAVSKSLQHNAYKSFANGGSYTVSAVATRIDGVLANAAVYVYYNLKEFKSGSS
jgi:hypothetical protein